MLCRGALSGSTDSRLPGPPGLNSVWAGALILQEPPPRQAISARGLFKGASRPIPPTPTPHPWSLAQAPGHPGMQRGWKESAANFLLVVSQGGWKIQHSQDLLLWGWAWCGRRNWQTLLRSSTLCPSRCPDSPASHVTLQLPTCPLPVPTFLIQSIKWPVSSGVL